MNEDVRSRRVVSLPNQKEQRPSRALLDRASDDAVHADVSPPSRALLTSKRNHRRARCSHQRVTTVARAARPGSIHSHHPPPLGCVCGPDQPIPSWRVCSTGSTHRRQLSPCGVCSRLPNSKWRTVDAARRGIVTELKRRCVGSVMSVRCQCDIVLEL